MYTDCKRLLRDLEFYSPLLRHLGHRNKVNILFDKALEKLIILKEFFKTKEMNDQLEKHNQHSILMMRIENLQHAFEFLKISMNCTEIEKKSKEDKVVEGYDCTRYYMLRSNTRRALINCIILENVANQKTLKVKSKSSKGELQDVQDAALKGIQELMSILVDAIATTDKTQNKEKETIRAKHEEIINTVPKTVKIVKNVLETLSLKVNEGQLSDDIQIIKDQMLLVTQSFQSIQ